MPKTPLTLSLSPPRGEGKEALECSMPHTGDWILAVWVEPRKSAQQTTSLIEKFLGGI
jgi:hypothetical protein